MYKLPGAGVIEFNVRCGMRTEEDIISAQWEANNAHVRYPFADYTALTSTNGVVLDNSTFVDARFYIIGGAQDLYLSEVICNGSVLTLNVADTENGNLASGSFDYNSPSDSIAFTDAYGRPAGIMVSSAEQLGLFAQKFGEGTTTFKPGQTDFVPSVVTPLPQIGVRGLLLDDGSVISGDVVLVGSDGVVLSVEDGVIRVDVLGNPYATLLECEEQSIPVAPFCGLRTINNIGPDSQGNFALSVGANAVIDPAVRITGTDGQVLISMLGLTVIPNG